MNAIHDILLLWLYNKRSLVAAASVYSDPRVSLATVLPSSAPETGGTSPDSIVLF